MQLIKKSKIDEVVIPHQNLTGAEPPHKKHEMTEPQIRIIRESDFTESLDLSVRDFLIDIFPNWRAIFQKGRTWHDAKPVFTVLATVDGKPVGHVAVVERTISTCWNWRYTVAGFQGVAVAPEFRKTGLSQRLLRSALFESTKPGYPFAILFCQEPLIRFYEQLGWKLPDDSMIMWKDRELPIPMRSDCPMYWKLGNTQWPEGPIDVHNPIGIITDC